jgi:hypothetical protein
MSLGQRAVMTGTSSPDQLRADIEETRARLADIADKLTPRAILAAQAKQRIQDTATAVADRTEELFDAVADRSGDLVEKVADRSGELVEKAKDATPDAALNAVSQAADEARRGKRPVRLLLLLAAAAVLGIVASKRS